MIISAEKNSKRDH